MKRLVLLTAIAALVSLGSAPAAQAQFGGFQINFGNGMQFDSNHGFRMNPRIEREHYDNERHRHDRFHEGHEVYRPGVPPSKGDHYDGHNHRARYVVRYRDGRGGHYFVRNGNHYYDRGYGTPVLARTGGFTHVDDLAIRLEQLTNELCLDMYYNYRHNPGFRETYREVYELYQLAKYIHDEEHHGHRDEIRRKLGGMDALFHHVQDDIRGWHRHHHRQIGSLGIVAKTQEIESMLHHLMNDVGVEFTDGLEEPPSPGAWKMPPRL